MFFKYKRERDVTLLHLTDYASHEEVPKLNNYSKKLFSYRCANKTVSIVEIEAEIEVCILRYKLFC